MSDMLIKIVKPDFTFTDERGTLAQLVHSGYEQVNFVYTEKGAVRGNMHYHALSDETFYVGSGKVKVTARLEDEEEERIFAQGDMFTLPAGVRHTFEYLENTNLVVLYTKAVEREDGSKDILTD
ncbi:MAG: cupin domain-containing protein [Clostridia bacterium]|nr:cupin domain-containing protein [Clostridia bacterium]